MRRISAPPLHLFRRKTTTKKHNLLYFRQTVAMGLNKIKWWEVKKTMLHKSFQQLLCSNTTRQYNKEAFNGPIKGCTVGLVSE